MTTIEPLPSLAATGTDAPAATQRPCEVHWKVNPVTRAQFTAAEQAAAEALGHRTDLVVLDVGCGRQSSLIIPGTKVLVGTDVDEKGLSRNGSIDHAVLSDIGSEDLPEETVDGIVSIFALEHITSPDVVIGRLVRTLRRGGVFVLAVPDVHSPKAFVTRHTPQAFHEWFYRWVLGRRGTGAGTPFPTVLDPVIAPESLDRLMAALGMTKVHGAHWEDNKQAQVRRKVFLTGPLWSAVRGLWRLVLRVDPARTDYIGVYRRGPAPEAITELGRLLRDLEPGAR